MRLTITARTALAIALLIVMAIGATGCEMIAKKAVEEATGVKVDESGENVTVTGPEGEELTISSSASTLPDGFPSDVPAYSTGKIESSSALTQDDGTHFTVAMTTADDYDSVFAWHKSEYEKSGWTIENEFTMEAEGRRNGQLYGKKGDVESWTWIAEDAGQLTITLQVFVP